MYKIVGADQKEYGPVTEEQLWQWISEGRANGQTLARFNDGPLKPLSTYPEFAAALGITLQAPGTTTPPPPPPSAPPPLTLGSGIPTSSAGPPPTHGMAIAGLVCGILGLFCCGPLFSTLGLVFSAIALSKINQDPLRHSGKGVALAGLLLSVLGYIFFAVLLSTGMFRRTFRRFPRYF
jgi:hypothetical protein